MAAHYLNLQLSVLLRNYTHHLASLWLSAELELIHISCSFGFDGPLNFLMYVFSIGALNILRRPTYDINKTE